jgi:hypothetical protein
VMQTSLKSRIVQRNQKREDANKYLEQPTWVSSRRGTYAYLVVEMGQVELLLHFLMECIERLVVTKKEARCIFWLKSWIRYFGA